MYTNFLITLTGTNYFAFHPCSFCFVFEDFVLIHLLNLFGNGFMTVVVTIDLVKVYGFVIVFWNLVAELVFEGSSGLP
jgi:hypothetical protein